MLSRLLFAHILQMKDVAILERYDKFQTSSAGQDGDLATRWLMSRIEERRLTSSDWRSAPVFLSTAESCVRMVATLTCKCAVAPFGACPCTISMASLASAGVNA